MGSQGSARYMTASLLSACVLLFILVIFIDQPSYREEDVSKIPRAMTDIIGNYTVNTDNKKREKLIIIPDQILWPDDPECSKFHTGFSMGLPLVWLVSFPRSGNSWTRYLLEAATGVLTNSIYHDPAMNKYGYPGEKEKVGSGRCVATKTHLVIKDLEHARDDHTPTILLIRNPSRSIVSLWNFKKATPGNYFFNNVGNDSYTTKEFHKWAETKIEDWRLVTESRLLWSRSLLVVPYEDLRTSPLPWLHSILDFLNVEVDSSRMSCLAKHVQGPVKGLQRTIDPFTYKEKHLLTLAIDRVTWLAKLRGVQLPDYTMTFNGTAI